MGSFEQKHILPEMLRYVRYREDTVFYSSYSRKRTMLTETEKLILIQRQHCQIYWPVHVTKVYISIMSTRTYINRSH